MYNFKQLQMASGKLHVKDFIHFGNKYFYNLGAGCWPWTQTWQSSLSVCFLDFLLVSREPKNQTHGYKSSLLVAMKKELINNPLGFTPRMWQDNSTSEGL